MPKTNKLTKKLKKEWIRALRSGEYKQCEEYLHLDGGFCCLGVLLDINEDVDWEQDEGDDFWTANIDGITHNHLYGQKIIGEAAAKRLANKNDRGESFNMIADWIEKNL